MSDSQCQLRQGSESSVSSQRQFSMPVLNVSSLCQFSTSIELGALLLVRWFLMSVWTCPNLIRISPCRAFVLGVEQRVIQGVEKGVHFPVTGFFLKDFSKELARPEQFLLDPGPKIQYLGPIFRSKSN